MVSRIKPQKSRLDNPEINIVCLAKGTERYVWLFSDELLGRAMCSAGKFAATPGMSLTWPDATRVIQRMKGIVHG